MNIPFYKLTIGSQDGLSNFPKVSYQVDELGFELRFALLYPIMTSLYVSEFLLISLPS